MKKTSLTSIAENEPDANNDEPVQEPIQLLEHNEDHVQEPNQQLIIDNDDDDEDDHYSDAEDAYYSHDDRDEGDQTDDDFQNLLENSEDEEEQIREWALTGNIPLILITQLLLILRRRLLPNLPKTATTFLGLNKVKFNILTVENSFYKSAQFVYFGIAKGLAMCFNHELHVDRFIYLDINIDGAALYKSSANQFWPILCRIHHSPEQIYVPFPVSVYMGSEKPQNLEIFLKEFVTEMNNLQKNGIVLNEKRYEVRMNSFILDTPARALVKCTKGHAGFYCCERCEIRGERICKRTVFTTINHTERTHDKFCVKSQPEHHTGTTPFVQLLGLNMIKMFVLDFMHLGSLGVMKKLLDLWLDGYIARVKFSFHQKQQLDFMLETIKNQIPIEFQRKTQSIKHIAYWKATQFGFFLLYSGVVILKNILPKKLYRHFLLLFTGCRILCSNETALRYNKHAKLYLERFVLLTKEYYGKSVLSINIHNLIHIADDCKNMNCNLNSISSYSFESLLGKIRKTLRTGYRPLEQLCNRMHEMFFRKKKIPFLQPTLVILKEQLSLQKDFVNVLKLKYNLSTLTTQNPNNIVLLKNEKCFEIRKMTRPIADPNDVLLEGVIWPKKGPFFLFPTNSAELGIWKLANKPENVAVNVRITNVKKKIVKLSVRPFAEGPETTVTLPLLH